MKWFEKSVSKKTFDEVSKLSELVDKRTINSKTFDLGYGKRKVIYTKEIIHYEQDGVFIDVDLSPVDDGSSLIFYETIGDVVVDKSVPRVSYVSNNEEVFIELKSVGGKKHLFDTAVFDYDRHCVIWSSVDIDVELVFKPHKIEFFKLIKNKSAPKTFDWEVTEKNIKTLKTNSRHKGKDNKGDDVYLSFEKKNENVDGGVRSYVLSEIVHDEIVVTDKKTRVKSLSSDIEYPLYIDVPDITETIAATADDGEELFDQIGSSYSWTDVPANSIISIYQLESGATMKYGGVRFTTVNLPNGAFIGDAQLKLDVESVTVANVDLLIYGDDVDDAAVWSTSDKPSGITKTTNSKKTTITTSTTGIQSFDVTAIVQELVDRTGWSSGNDMRFSLENQDFSFSDGILKIYDASHSTGTAASLEITYSDTVTKIDDASDFGAMPSGGRQLVRDSNGSLHAVVNDTNRLEVWRASSSTSTTCYFDASDAGPTDPDGVWTGDANGVDGSVDTDATSQDLVGSESLYYLEIQGTNASAAVTSGSTVGVRIHNGTSWSSVFPVATPSGGWTLTKVQGLEMRIWTNGLPSLQLAIYEDGNAGGTSLLNIVTNATLTFSKVEVLIFEPGSDMWLNCGSYTSIITDSTYVDLAAAIDSSDVIHLAYTNGSSDGVYRAYNCRTQTFGSEESIETVQLEHYMYEIVVDSNDVPHLIYGLATDGINDWVYYKNRVGGSWNASVLLVTSTFTSGSISINSSDVPEVTFVDLANTTVFVKRGNVNNSTSFTNHSLDTSVNVTVGTSGCSIACHPNGDTWVAYVDGNDNVTLAHHPEASSWTAGWTFTSTGVVGSEPSILLLGDGVYVFYENSVGGVAYDVYDGSSWSNTIDGLSETYQTNTLNSIYSTEEYGQSFVGNGSDVTDITVYLQRYGSPTGSVYIDIYAGTGTYGGGGDVGTGSVLATSDAVDVTSIPSGSFGLIPFAFTGSNSITLSSTGYYVYVVKFANGDASNYLRNGADITDAHSGNQVHYNGSTFTAYNAYDACFYVHSSDVVFDSVISQDVTTKWSMFNNNSSSGTSQYSLATYYFDASDAGPTDNDAVWTSDSNAFDGSTSTSAQVTVNGSTTTNELRGEGTNAPASGGTIVGVRARIYAVSTETAEARYAIYTDGEGELLVSVATGGINGWDGYEMLSVPSGGWTWGKVQALECIIYASNGGTYTLDVYKLELDVITENTPTEIDFLFSDGTDVYYDYLTLQSTNSDTITSAGHLSRDSPAVATGTSEESSGSMASFVMTPHKTVGIKTIMLKCKGDQAGADSTAKLTLNGVDSDTINIGRSGDTAIYRTFTFTNAVTVTGSQEYTVTITGVSNGVLVTGGSGDNSGWGMRGDA